MIFGQEYVVFEILDVLYLDQACTRMYNSNRNFDAISFRYEADTVIEADKKQTELYGNSICYVPANMNYSRISQKDRLIVIHFKTFNYHSDSVEAFTPENPEKYRRLFEEALSLWNGRGIGYKNECAAVLNRIFAEIYRENEPEFKNKSISESVMYIDKNCTGRDFSLTEAAAKSFMSETYFRRLFKKEFGVSPKQYVINRRMENAKALIITGYYSVKEIAELCGYNDEKHFSVEFRKHTGVSPSKFRYNY